MRGTITQDVVTDTLVLNPDVELIEEKRIDSEFEATNITALEVYHRESKIQKYINLILKRIIFQTFQTLL